MSSRKIPSKTSTKSQAEPETAGDLLQQLAHSLHDLCQPLTALQCRLEIDQMEREEHEPANTNRTIADCLRECERLNQIVTTMRTLVRRALANQQESHE